MPKNLTKTEQQQYDTCLGQCTVCMLKSDCGLRIKVKGIETVDATINSYQWICLDCGWVNVTQIKDVAKCINCDKEFRLKVWK